MTDQWDAAAEGGSDARPLVSVVIPCCNYARFLGQAIESVLRQTWHSVEIIVVDDGSVDETAVVIAHYASVKGIWQSNQGLAAARNTGLRASRGQYVTFLDADDLLLPTALEVGMRELAAHPECAFVSGGFWFVNEDGNIIGNPCIPEITDDPYLAWLRECYIQGATVLHRRNVLERVGGFEPLVSGADEWDLYLRIARQFPVWQHRELVVHYRQHEASMKRDIRRMTAVAFRVYTRQLPYLGNDHRRRAAYRTGKRELLDVYYRSLLKESLSQLMQPGSRRAGLKGMILVLTHAPWRFCKEGAKYFMRPGYHRLLALLTSWRHRNTSLDFIRRLLFAYSAKLPKGWQKVEWTIGFHYREPIGKIRLALRTSGSDGFVHGEVFEQEHYRLPLGSSPATILDLGANIGLTAVYFGRLFPNAELACVEPVVENLRMLTRNLELNAIQAKVIAAAIHVKDGRVLMERHLMDWEHKIAAPGSSRPTFEVTAISVPTILRQLCWDRIGLLRVDIEGHEKTLFSANCDWLDSVDAMCIECHEGFDEADLRSLAHQFGLGPPQYLSGIWLMSRGACN